MIEELGIAEEEVQAVIAHEEKAVRRREALYRGGKPGPNLAGKTVIIVDDGLATGSTMTAAVRSVRSSKPLRIVVAVPVGSSQACKRLQAEADEVVCLAIPEYFIAVGEWYKDFDQISDGEVAALLAQNAERLKSYEAHNDAA
jgi:predicted phosphoribosyltransferase